MVNALKNSEAHSSVSVILEFGVRALLNPAVTNTHRVTLDESPVLSKPQLLLLQKGDKYINLSVVEQIKYCHE